jgi:hypothetical protein
MRNPGYAFSRVYVITAFVACAKLWCSLLDVGVKLLGIVERGHHDMSALSPIRVIAIVPNDPAIDAVIIWIHPGHGHSIRWTAS